MRHYRGVRSASVVVAMVVGVVLSFAAASPASATKPPFVPPSGGVAASQQFGIPDQTDVFTVDGNGALDVSWVDGGGTWNGFNPITSNGFTVPGGGVAASRQFGIPDQTDVFTVDGNGALDVSWVDGDGAWGGPVPITGAKFAPAGSHVAASRQFGIPDQTDVFTVDNNGALNVSWVDGDGAWNGPVPITQNGYALPGAGVAASQQFGIPDQTDVFTVDNSGAVNVSFVDGGGAWGGPAPITGAKFAPAGSRVAASQQFGIPDQTDVFTVDNSGAVNVSFVDGGGAWGGPAPITGANIAPAGSHVAASQQFGIPDQTDVFTLGSALNVSFVDGGGAWGGPVPVTGP